MFNSSLTPTDMTLSSEHLIAVNRPRRIIFQDDVLANYVFRSKEVGPERLAKIIDFYMSRLDAEHNQIDSVWHEWGEGNTAVWPSDILPRSENVFPRWWATGTDPIEILLNETRNRGREVFFSYRINGSDNDRLFDPPHPFDRPIPIKAEHPEWIFRKWHAYWNFAIAKVRELKLRILREVAGMYDFDGISVDFARVPVLFAPGKQWECRDLLTDFMRQLRSALFEVGQRRGRPFLLAARVPENQLGCHFDGIDVESWVRESLVDFLVVGARTTRADVTGFQKMTDGTPVKIYPSWDDHHSSDGYRHPPLEVWRGVCANWWRQGADGMHTFNLMMGSPESERALGIKPAPRHRGGEADGTDLIEQWRTQCHVFSEIGSAQTLHRRNKVFFVERRGGGHDAEVIPDPDSWYTPRHMYFQSNMQAPLPVNLLEDGSADTLLELDVADDVNALTQNITETSLLLAYSIEVERNSTEDRSEKGEEATIEIRINNLRLDDPRPSREVETALNVSFDHWLKYKVPPRYLALGANLIGIRLREKPTGFEGPVRIEKLELHVVYG